MLLLERSFYMEKNIYNNIEREVKKYKHFGMDNRLDYILMFVFYFLMLASAILIIFNSKIGWPVLGAILLCMSLSSTIAPSIIVVKYFKNENNRKIIQSILAEKAKTEKKSKKLLNELDFSKPLKWGFAFTNFRVDYLKKLILQTYPSILEIIKKHGITTSDALKEAIEHYRSKIETTKEFKFSLIPILSLILPLVSTFFKDNTISIIITITLTTLSIILYSIINWYKSTYYIQYSKKSFYKNMEQALSEIYISNELNRSIRQFGFTSHLL